ncbi:MAG TPA: hypothetical protein VE953_22270 [Terriglobales bacterium]|nr:hypothetical protein [Terriglobales bacterium]
MAGGRAAVPCRSCRRRLSRRAVPTRSSAILTARWRVAAARRTVAALLPVAVVADGGEHEGEAHQGELQEAGPSPSWSPW